MKCIGQETVSWGQVWGIGKEMHWTRIRAICVGIQVV